MRPDRPPHPHHQRKEKSKRQNHQSESQSNANAFRSNGSKQKRDLDQHNDWIAHPKRSEPKPGLDLVFLTTVATALMHVERMDVNEQAFLPEHCFLPARRTFERHD